MGPAWRDGWVWFRAVFVLVMAAFIAARGNASTIRLRADAKRLLAELLLFGEEGEGRLARRIEIAPARRPPDDGSSRRPG